MQVSEENFKTLQSDNILLLQSVARLSEELRIVTAEKNAALAIINSENNAVISPWINEASAYFAAHPFTTDTEMSQFLWEFVTDVRSAKLEGMDFEEDADE